MATKRFFIRLVKMEANTRKAMLAGKRRVFVDREQDGSFTIVLPGGSVHKFAISLDAAMFLRDFAVWQDSVEMFHFHRSLSK